VVFRNVLKDAPAAHVARAALKYAIGQFYRPSWQWSSAGAIA